MIPGNAPLRRYIKGNAFFSEVTTENLNQTVDELDRLRNDERSNREPLRVGDGNVTEVRLGTITSAGPNSEPDKTNNSYWIAPQRPDPSLSFGDALTLDDENLPDLADIFLATNLSEVSTSHLLATDETLDVILFSVTFDTFPTITHWFFSIAPPQWIRIRIGSATQDGSNKRWKYDWSEYEKSTQGYGGWTAVSGGRTGHAATWGYAYNMVEDGNGASGLYGNGVDSSNLVGTLDIQPVPPNQVIVLASVVYPINGTVRELWFSYENGIDGGCS